MAWPLIPLAICMCGKLLFHKKLSAIIESRVPSFFGLYKNKSIYLSAWLFNLSRHLSFYVVIPLLMILKSTLICFQLFKFFSIIGEKKYIHLKLWCFLAIILFFSFLLLSPFLCGLHHCPCLDANITPELQYIINLSQSSTLLLRQLWHLGMEQYFLTLFTSWHIKGKYCCIWILLPYSPAMGRHLPAPVSASL